MKRRITGSDIPPNLKYAVLQYLSTLNDRSEGELGSAPPPAEDQIAEVLSLAIGYDVVEADKSALTAYNHKLWEAYTAQYDHAAGSPELKVIEDEVQTLAGKVPAVDLAWDDGRLLLFMRMMNEIHALRRAVQLGIATVCNLPEAGQKKAADFAIKEARDLFKEAREELVKHG